jgi:1-acyl-sn-glycerol-3-phosphate acyltransferase
MRMVFRLLARWEVEGRENVPRAGGLIVVANHVHYLDPPLIDASMPRPMLFMAKQELVTQTKGWQHKCILWYGLIPVDRRRLNWTAFQAARDHLEGGGVIGIFPEGTRGATGVLQTPQPGAAYLALATGAPLLPAAVIGLAGLKLSWKTVLRRPRVTVRIGAPFQLPVSEKPDRSTLQAASIHIMEAIADLLPEEQRGPFGRTRTV